MVLDVHDGIPDVMVGLGLVPQVDQLGIAAVHVLGSAVDGLQLIIRGP